MESGAYMTNINEEELREFEHGQVRYTGEYDKLIPKFNDFMDRYSEIAARSRRNQLIYFSLWINAYYDIKIDDENIETITKFIKITDQDKVTIKELELFFKEDIDERNIKRETKRHWRSLIFTYYEYYKEFQEKYQKNPNFINPVPSKNFLKFTRKKVELKDLETEEHVLTYEIAEKILNRLFFTNKRTFIFTSIILYTGARVSEVVKIKLENISFKERFFLTEIKGDKNKVGIYFFPKFFIKHLKGYIEKEVKTEFPNTSFLFPTPYKRRTKDLHISSKTPRKDLRLLRDAMNLKCRINPHAFRSLINEERFDTSMKKKYRFLLLNQTPTNVNTMAYLRKYKKRKELQQKYDEFFPFPEFDPDLSL